MGLRFTPAEFDHHQARLCQVLQILRHHNFRGQQSLLRPQLKEGQTPQVEWIELELLRVIATCLSTGEKGETVAATLDRRRAITVVLSKNRPVSSADKEAASCFFAALCNPLDGCINVVTAIATYGERRMQKRISKLLESFAAVREYLQERINGYAAGPPSEEFYESFLTAFCGTDTSMGSHGILHHAVEKFHSSTAAFDITSIHLPKTLTAFIRLCYYAGIFLESKFMKSIILALPTSELHVHKFCRRLEKLALYTRGIDHLIAYRKRLAGPLEVRWAHFPDMDDTPTIELVPTAQEAACDARIIDEPEEPFYEKYPKREWITRLQLSYHAEMRLILYLDSDRPSVDATQLIGCSKRSCCCCRLWLEEYNTTRKTRWILAEFNGKLDMEWRIPRVLPGLDLFVSLCYKLDEILAWMGDVPWQSGAINTIIQ